MLNFHAGKSCFVLNNSYRVVACFVNKCPLATYHILHEQRPFTPFHISLFFDRHHEFDDNEDDGALDAYCADAKSSSGGSPKISNEPGVKADNDWLANDLGN